jgi:membrane-bound lytic murein transglycosylase F
MIQTIHKIYTAHHITTAVRAMAFILMVVFFSACSLFDRSDTDPITQETNSAALITEPVERDFDEILKSGVLRVITRYNSNAYFLHRGIERGFEYELAAAFAREHNLALEVIILREDDNPADLLNSGAGDFIAANYTITPDRREYVGFTSPYDIVSQIIVLNNGGSYTGPKTMDDLNGMSISVRKGTSYYSTLTALVENGEASFRIQTVPETWDTEALIMAVADGEFDATVADNNLYLAASSYIKDVEAGPVISQADTVAWAVRKNAVELQERMSQFLGRHFRISELDDQPRRSAFMNILRRRYFEDHDLISKYRNPVIDSEYTGLISPYDELVIPIADSAGIDWKLVVAVMAQESRFDPMATSWAGAVGLMQIIPRFSHVEDEALLYDPETSIREGIRFLKKHLNHYSYMDEQNQLAFALATYNSGMGHIADARRLAIDQNRNPNEWDDVSQALLMLMKPNHYKNARYGFARGIETVNYVRDITSRYQMYDSIVALTLADAGPSIRNSARSGSGMGSGITP